MNGFEGQDPTSRDKESYDWDETVDHLDWVSNEEVRETNHAITGALVMIFLVLIALVLLLIIHMV